MAGQVIDFVRGMKPTNHVVFFYDVPENKRKVLFDFLAAGLRKRKGAFYICSEETPQKIRNGMKSFGINVEETEREGKLIVRNYDEWYLESERVEYIKILAGWREIYEKFRAKGLGLRGTGEMDCFFKHNKVKELLRYEYALHRVLDIPMEAICAYNIHAIVSSGYSEVIMPLIRAHGWAIFTGPGGSMVYEPENVEDYDIERLLQIRI